MKGILIGARQTLAARLTFVRDAAACPVAREANLAYVRAQNASRAGGPPVLPARMPRERLPYA
ncbi:protein of unknown function [Hyphomicrobium sp. MC1]|nr:protein of unknown function [Hyphomicrobium sp. MC1]